MKIPDLANSQAHTITRGGIQLHFVRAGTTNRTPLFLCHGLTDNGMCWYRTAKVLARDFDIIMLDARNHGLSGDGPAGAHDLAADLAYLGDHFNFDRVIVMGHSVGAVVAATFAADFPVRAEKIVLEDPPWRASNPTPDPNKAAKQHAGFAKHVQMMRRQSEDAIIAMGRDQHPTWDAEDLPDWAAAKKQVRENATVLLDLGEWSELVPAITCPSLLLFGDQDNGCDGIVTAEVAHAVTELNPLIEARHVQSAGHNLRREQFDGFITAVKAFLT